MGFSVYCTFCGLTHYPIRDMNSFMPPFSQPGKNWSTWNNEENVKCFERFIRSIGKVKTKWLENVVVIDKNGQKVASASAGESYNDTVYADGRTFSVVTWDSNHAYEAGILVHAACYRKIKKVASKKENLFETYKHFVPVREDTQAKHMLRAFGKRRTQHWYQDPVVFENNKFILNKKDVDIASTYCVGVYHKIHKMIDTRKAPVQSATAYKIGFKKIGVDGNTYIIKKVGTSKRWVRIVK